jgi:hypothetical protein
LNLRYKPISDGESFPTLDFTTDGGKDPLGVNKFFHNDLQTYRKNNLSTVWIVRDSDEPVAYFTVSMNAIEVKELGVGEKVEDTTTSRYPAVLLGQMGVDKNHRHDGIALAICDFCLGLASEIGERIACRYLMLQTTEELLPLYQGKAHFVKSLKKPSKDGKFWMYRRLA